MTQPPKVRPFGRLIMRAVRLVGLVLVWSFAVAWMIGFAVKIACWLIPWVGVFGFSVGFGFCK